MLVSNLKVDQVVLIVVKNNKPLYSKTALQHQDIFVDCWLWWGQNTWGIWKVPKLWW